MVQIFTILDLQRRDIYLPAKLLYFRLQKLLIITFRTMIKNKLNFVLTD